MGYKYNYIYKTTNLINGKFYVGRHSSNKEPEKDRYLGSGKNFIKALKKHRRINFKREILEFCDNFIEMCEKEVYWIKKLNAVKSPLGYNAIEAFKENYFEVGHIPWNTGLPKEMQPHFNHKTSDEVKKESSIRMKNNNPMKSKESRDKLSQKRKQTPHLQESSILNLKKATEANIGSKNSDKTRTLKSKNNCRYWKGADIMHNSKPIYRVDGVTGEILQRYNSMAIARKEFGSHAYRCATELKGTVKGFIFLLEEDLNKINYVIEINKIKFYGGNSRNIIIFYKNKVYYSIQEASKHEKVSVSIVDYNIKNRIDGWNFVKNEDYIRDLKIKHNIKTIMSKLPTLYIPIKKQTGNVQLLSTKRISKITELFPSKEEMLSHIYMERQLSILNEGYVPEPYIVSVSVENYDMIINEIQKKVSKYYTKSISLKASSKSATIIKIVSIDE